MIIALDTETYKFDKADNVYRPVLDAREFALGCYKTDKGKIRYFTDREEMYLELIGIIKKNIEHKKRTFIYGHNIEYDWYAFAQKHLLDSEMKYIVFHPFIGIYNNKGYFLDTMAFYRMSLEKVGEILKFPKLEMPQEIRDLEDLKPYLLRDVEITLEAILSLKRKVKKLGFSPRKLLTAGQLAMTSFLTFTRRNGSFYEFTVFDEEKKIRHIYKTKFANKVRKSFRGGNNTAFQIGKFENCTLLDINGLYGKAMEEMDFPDLSTEKYIDNIGAGMLKLYLDKEIGVAECTIKAPNLKLGYLPIRYGGYTLFPTNKTLIGTWTFKEIKRALELGYELEDVKWCIRWKKAKINPLRDFIKHLYELEQKAESKEERSVIKLIRNNLYGKFAQYKKSKDYKIVKRSEVEKYADMGYKVASCIDNKYVCTKDVDDYEPSYTNPIISSLITAWSRDFLYNELIKVPKEDLLYCDTDSILFKGEHLNKFDIGNELGQFKIEKDSKGNPLIGKDCKILGEKRYYIDEEVKVSGVPTRYRNKSALDEEEDIIMDRMYGIKEAIDYGDFHNVGKFMKKSIEMKSHAKYMIATPDTIDETHLLED